MTAPDRERQIANRELGTVEGFETGGRLRLRLDAGRTVDVNLKSHVHLDYGFAVTSHSSQGQTADRVLVHVDTERAFEQQVNRRLAYVAISRGRYDAQVYTNDKAHLAEAINREVSHVTALQHTTGRDLRHRGALESAHGVQPTINAPQVPDGSTTPAQAHRVDRPQSFGLEP